MSDVQPETAGVQAQYAARVATDLETNRTEQERIGAEVAALQEQLQSLEKDHALLLSMQQALGSPSTPAAAAKKTSTRKKAVPAPRASANNSSAARTKKPTATKSKDKDKDQGKAAKSAPKAVAKKPSAPAAGPTLVELIDNHLGRQSEPRSAAEITSALAQDLPDRSIKTTVVRTTVEGLVAKGRAHRTKQGSSVFYTSVTPAEEPAAPQPETTSTS
ncbi:hypothetical protein M4V62_01030 [Streptomyces durmitorensis]|uniref:Regulatory protein n=1 Tax=Streptomyces durmitorensis TaxID=319947 RepID=A0ABY4PJS1_9ACTN|nr:hypothetical protein [Streptomyces durmitorensis]UQT53771.1 hypothetical protein M4V62_01030 [Streptomyces durmitorensis]